MPEQTICALCGHSKGAHWDRYGCQVEDGDAWVEGTDCGGWQASGPCCCKDFEAEQEESHEAK